MAQFHYCSPFAVFDGSPPGVVPAIETRSLREALSIARTRPQSSLTISVLVIDGQISTLIPVTLTATDLAGKDVAGTENLISSYAERRFRSMPAEGRIAAFA